MNSKLIFAFTLLLVLTVSSCLTSKGILKANKGKEKKGTVEKRTEIGNNPKIKSLLGSIGARRDLGIGIDGAIMLDNLSRIDASIFLYGNIGPASSNDPDQQASPKRIIERHFMSASYSYPLLNKTNYQEGVMYLYHNSDEKYVNSPIARSTFILKDKFKIIHLFNLVGGIEHGYSQFRTEVYSSVLRSKFPDAKTSVTGSFNDVAINNGSYYAKFGISSTRYINTHLDGNVEDLNISGNISRELHFGLNALIGLYSHIPKAEVRYKHRKDGLTEYRTDQVNFEKHLNYSRIGFELSFHWAHFLNDNLSYKYGLSLGLMPGHRNPGKWGAGALIKANLAFGFGRISKRKVGITN